MIEARVLLRKTQIPENIRILHVQSTLQLDHLENDIARIWDEIQNRSTSHGSSLWDGIYYRLENVSDLAQGTDLLKISTVKYSTVRSLIEYCKAGSLQAHNFPYHINTGSFVKTKDDKYIFGVKLRTDGSAYFDLIGGGLQSSELQVNSGQDIAENMMKEIFEEINLGKNSILNIEILGYILASNTSIIIVFNSETALASSDLKNLFAERKDLELHDIAVVPSEHISSFLKLQAGYFPLLDNFVTSQS